MLSAVVLLAGCGSGSDSATSPPSAESSAHRLELDPEQAARIEGICSQSGEETAQLRAHLAQAISASPSPDAIGAELVVPGIRILDREASQLASVQAASNAPQLETFIGLFDPIIELAEQRVEAGEASEPERGQALERLIAGLADEQAAIARQLELDACSLTFTEALGGQR